jgi:hypothetical protein
MVRTRTIALATLLLFSWTVLEAGEDQTREYSMPECGYRVQIPSDWTVYKEEKLGVAARVSFGLPTVWGELEGSDIENAVSICAYKRKDIANLEEVVRCERDRVADILVSCDDVDLEFGRAQLSVTRIRGREYKNLSAFDLKHGIAYVFSFTATEGTYDTNVDLFTGFLRRLEFFEPEGKADDEGHSLYDEARDLYRAGPFNARRVIALLENDLRNNPEKLEALKLLAITYTGAGRFIDALAVVDRAIAAEQAFAPRMHLLKAKVLHYLDRNTEARDFLTARSAFFDGDSSLSDERDRLLIAIEAAMSQE